MDDYCPKCKSKDYKWEDPTDTYGPVHSLEGSTERMEYIEYYVCPVCNSCLKRRYIFDLVSVKVEVDDEI